LEWRGSESPVQREPEWMNDDGTAEDASGGHSVEEFELWKAKMKAQELRASGYDVPDPQPAMKEQIKLDSGVDRLFDTWSSGKARDERSVASVASSHASRFSSFFNTSSSSAASPSTSAAPQTSAPTLQSNATTSPPPTTKPREADKQGFQRIMAMLGQQDSSFAAAAAIQNPIDTTNSSTSIDDKSAVSPDTAEADNDKGNDMFFMSLLNKGSKNASSTSVTDVENRTEDKRTLPNESTASRTAPQTTPPTQPSPIENRAGPYPPPGLGPANPAELPFLPPPPPGWFNQQGKPNFPPDFVPPPPPFGHPPPMGFPPFFGQMPPPGYDPRHGLFPPPPPPPPPPPLNADGTPRFPFPRSDTDQLH
jgi:hypothetical protein